MRHPRVFELLGLVGRAFLHARAGGGWIRSLPGPLKGWTDSRDFPPLAAQSFRQLWRARSSGGSRPGLVARFTDRGGAAKATDDRM